MGYDLARDNTLYSITIKNIKSTVVITLFLVITCP